MAAGPVPGTEVRETAVPVLRELTSHSFSSPPPCWVSESPLGPPVYHRLLPSGSQSRNIKYLLCAKPCCKCKE